MKITAARCIINFVNNGLPITEELRNEAKKQKKQITIHVRCSTDLIGLEMLRLLPESNGSFDDMVDELAKNNMFNQLMCGKTYKV